MATIGCDYSAKEAYFSIVEDEKVLQTAKVVLKGDLSEQRRDYLDALTKVLNSFTQNCQINDELFIEQPWVAGSRFPMTAIQLARNCAYIEVAALAAGFDVRFVHISTWRKAIYGNGKPTDTKGTAIAWVLYNLGFETKNHNYAEASCIAQYGEKYA